MSPRDDIWADSVLFWLTEGRSSPYARQSLEKLGCSPPPSPSPCPKCAERADEEPQEDAVC